MLSIILFIIGDIPIIPKGFDDVSREDFAAGPGDKTSHCAPGDTVGGSELPEDGSSLEKWIW
jgi:hypothetical protein